MMGSKGGLKQRGNKLHNFVLGDGVDEEFQTALVTQDDADVPSAEIALGEPAKPSREDIAGEVRLAMPQPRHGIRHLRERSLASQQNARSPVRSQHASPRPAPSQMTASDHCNGLFAPSILGEDFMRSEASTPHPPDSQEQDENAFPRRRSEFQPMKNSASRWTTHRPELVEDTPKFVTNDDGFMQVVKGGKRYTPTALRDGFTRDTYHDRERAQEHANDRRLPPQTLERHDGLPIRTEPRRLIKPKEDHARYTARPISPAYEPEQWTPGRQYEVERSPPHRLGSVHPPPSEVSSEVDVGFTSRPKGPSTETYGGATNAEGPTQHTSRNTSRNRKRHRENPDYDDQVLSSMSYKDLRNEAFDFDPSKAALAGVTHDGVHDLATKLEQRRHRGEEEQCQFFASMPMKEWEESGDWLIDQFAALVKKMRDARREKRRAIQEFEEEAERREEMVRTRSDAIDRKLGKMRQDGLKVVGDMAS